MPTTIVFIQKLLFHEVLLPTGPEAAPIIRERREYVLYDVMMYI